MLDQTFGPRNRLSNRDAKGPIVLFNLRADEGLQLSRRQKTAAGCKLK